MSIIGWGTMMSGSLKGRDGWREGGGGTERGRKVEWTEIERRRRKHTCVTQETSN
jgi:hypothetical protein